MSNVVELGQKRTNSVTGRVLVCGGRNYNDKRRVFETLDLLDIENRITLIIEGGASGADSLGRDWAQARYKPVLTVYADWVSLGPKAGPIRNKEMLEWNPDYVVAFPGGIGTANMIKLAKEAGINVMEIGDE